MTDLQGCDWCWVESEWVCECILGQVEKIWGTYGGLGKRKVGHIFVIIEIIKLYLLS